MLKEKRLGPIARIENQITPYPWALDRPFLERVRFFLNTSVWPGAYDEQTTRHVLANLIRGDINDGFFKDAATKMRAVERFGLA